MAVINQNRRISISVTSAGIKFVTELISLWESSLAHYRRYIYRLISIKHSRLLISNNHVSGACYRRQRCKDKIQPVQLSQDESRSSTATADVGLHGLALRNEHEGHLLTLKCSGNLTTKSLTPIVDPALLVQDSEYIETHLIVVPANSKKDFIKSYETLSPMVVPRSSIQVAQDDEFVLFAVATFKKHSAEFLQKCREQKWTPRQYKYVEGGREEEQRELDKVTNEERKVSGEALRMGRTGWSESVMVWIHVLTLRVFVEAVLRYGLPLDYVTAIVKVCFLCAPLVRFVPLDSTLATNKYDRRRTSWLAR